MLGQAKHVSGKNVFCSMNVYKCRGKRIFEIVHWPFELPANQHRPTGPFGWHKWCSLARPSKGQCTISKILSSLIFSLFIEQNIFFPETCFAYPISEQKFTVWVFSGLFCQHLHRPHTFCLTKCDKCLFEILLTMSQKTLNINEKSQIGRLQ